MFTFEDYKTFYRNGASTIYSGCVIVRSKILFPKEFDFPEFPEFMEWVSEQTNNRVVNIYAQLLRNFIETAGHLNYDLNLNDPVVKFCLAKLLNGTVGTGRNNLHLIFPTHQDTFKLGKGTSYTRFNDNFSAGMLEQFIKLGLDVTTRMIFTFEVDLLDSDDVFEMANGYSVELPLYVYLSNTPEKFKVMAKYIKDDIATSKFEDRTNIIDYWANFSSNIYYGYYTFDDYPIECFVLYLQYHYKFTFTFRNNYDAQKVFHKYNLFPPSAVRSLKELSQLCGWKNRVDMSKLPEIFKL